MTLENYFPIWDALTENEKNSLARSAVKRSASKGAVLHNGPEDCAGLFVVRSGQLRAFILSDEGREVTLYRLFERDICLFSASCIMSSIQFNISVEAERDTEMWVIPAEVYKKLMESSAAVANYTNQLMAARFTEVMWLIEQIMWKSLDKRLAAFLSEESLMEESVVLSLTHEHIANHLGTAREVVTRLLRYFQSEGLVSLSRGTVTLTNADKLRRLAE